MVEQTQCVNCDLVQFRTQRNVCRRCGAPLPERPPLPELKPDPPVAEIPARRHPRCTVPSGLILPLEETIRRAVFEAMDQCEGNVLLAAEHLEIGKTTLYRYLRRWGWRSPYRRTAALPTETGESAVPLKQFGT